MDREKNTARFSFALPQSLLDAFRARAKEENIDDASYARLAFSLISRRGTAYGQEDKPQKQSKNSHNSSSLLTLLAVWILGCL